MIKRLLVSEISMSRTQTRHSINQDAVDDYAERMEEGDAFPPPVVFSKGGAPYELASGFHRVNAAIKCGYTEIDCEVMEGDVHDAIIFGAKDNHTHGLRRTNEDKARSVRMYIEALAAKGQSLSDRGIADALGVDHKTVGRYREETTGEIPQSRTGVDGRTINTARIGKKQTPAARSNASTPPAEAATTAASETTAASLPKTSKDAIPTCAPFPDFHRWLKALRLDLDCLMDKGWPTPELGAEVIAELQQLLALAEQIGGAE